MRRTLLLVLVVSGCSMLLTAPVASAGPWQPRPTVSPDPGCPVPPPWAVPGKEYSDELDKNGHPNAGVLDPGQVIAWDGIGGTADSSLDHVDAGDEQVDALSHPHDLLFFPVIEDRSTLLFSTGITGSDTLLDDHVLFERPAACAGWGVWAYPWNINQVVGLPENLDGLEVWGPDRPDGDDATNFSLYGEPLADPASGRIVSVWGPSGPVFANELAAAIDPLFPLFTVEVGDIDVDAMMTNDPWIMFSLAPVTGRFDGGEIFVWSGSGPATFLFHGGHLWNTVFDVRGTFGTGSENVDALEAVSTPEPTGLLLVGLGLIGVAIRRRRRS